MEHSVNVLNILDDVLVNKVAYADKKVVSVVLDILGDKWDNKERYAIFLAKILSNPGLEA